LIALDSDTGKLVWEKHVAEADKYELMIMAPLVHEDLVISGIGISEYGVKGWIGAFRLSDGEPVWRFNTVPGEGEPGFDTWGSTDETPRGGGGIWVTPSFDAEKGLLYVAVGNPAPDFFGGVRMGKNLYTAAMVVLDAKSGKLRWFRQFVPHDQHDWDLTITNPLYSTVIGGAHRPVVSVAGKDGVLARSTGKVTSSSMKCPSRHLPTRTRSPLLKASTPVLVSSAASNGALLPSVRRWTCLSRPRWIGAESSRRRTSCGTSRGSNIWADHSHSIPSGSRAVG
jgi:glucose dehydrogenase